jgi:predicted dehydrogenase
MNLIIFGSGRMGIRHAIGASSNMFIDKIILIDHFDEALNTAKKQLEKLEFHEKFSFCHISEITQIDCIESLVIIATPAKERKKICEAMVDRGAKIFLIEKPLGQNLKEVLELSKYLKRSFASAYVNLNMRLYESFLSLKKDLLNIEQFWGYKIISINTGSIGIGANGIHYLDMLFFLMNADDARVISGEIEKQTLSSGRGSDYADFGGWCTIKFYNKKVEVGRAHLSITTQSSAFGNWEIITPHGQIIIDEISQKRHQKIRKKESKLPIERYGSDYLPMESSEFISPFLGDLTSLWIDSIFKGKSNLPTISESIKIHQLMFDWLSLSTYHKQFPIT